MVCGGIQHHKEGVVVKIKVIARRFDDGVLLVCRIAAILALQLFKLLLVGEIVVIVGQIVPIVVAYRRRPGNRPELRRRPEMPVS